MSESTEDSFLEFVAFGNTSQYTPGWRQICRELLEARARIKALEATGSADEARDGLPPWPILNKEYVRETRALLSEAGAPCFCGQKDGRHDYQCSAHPRMRTNEASRTFTPGDFITTPHRKDSVVLGVVTKVDPGALDVSGFVVAGPRAARGSLEYVANWRVPITDRLVLLCPAQRTNEALFCNSGKFAPNSDQCLSCGQDRSVHGSRPNEVQPEEKNKRLAETLNPDGTVTKREWTPRERYMLFEAGFRTGAGNRAIDPARAGLGAYDRGLEEGRAARAKALQTYAHELNFDPSAHILRR